MTSVTSAAALETADAIWNYDPEEPDNRVLNNQLDYIAFLRTLGIKVCANSLFRTLPHALQIQSSGQRIEEFHKIQTNDCDIENGPLSMVLHGNTRWGTAHGMMDRGIILQDVRRLLGTSCEN